MGTKRPAAQQVSKSAYPTATPANLPYPSAFRTSSETTPPTARPSATGHPDPTTKTITAKTRAMISEVPARGTRVCM